MNFINYCDRYDFLNEDKKALIEKLNNFLLNEKKYIFIIKGNEYTGKIFIINCLTEYLKTIKKEYQLLSPLSIINNELKDKYETIYSHIYDNSFPFLSTHHKSNDINKKDNHLYIINLASYISDEKDNGNLLFGSGKLLSDLMSFIDCKNKKNKIIFIGDDLLLPPINMNSSPALNEEYLREEFKLEVETYKLTHNELSHDSGIYLNICPIIKSIKQETFNELYIDTNYKEIKHIDENNFIREYKEIYNDIQDYKHIMIITYTNYLAKHYNELVRKNIFNRKADDIYKDDIIIINSGNYYIGDVPINNGAIGIVTDVQEREYKTINTPFGEKNFIFRNVTIYFEDINFQYKGKIIENLLYSENADLTMEENISLYIDFIERNKETNIKLHLIYEDILNLIKLDDEYKNNNEFKESFCNKLASDLRKLLKDNKLLCNKYKEDSYLRAFRAKFAHAITCHKSQASTWDNIFIDCKNSDDDNINNQLNDYYYRWIYTAITRAKKQLYLLNEPKIKFLSKIKNAIHQKNIENKNTDLSITINIENDMEENKFQIITPIQENIYKSVLSVLNSLNINISSISHHNYQEQYTFNDKNETCIILIHYNKNNSITKIRPKDTNQLSSTICDKLIVLENKTFSSILKTENEFEFEKTYLKEFYTSICNLLKPKGIKIQDIKHFNFRERYIFTNGTLSSEIDFIYNKKGQFTDTDTRRDSLAIEKILKEIL